MKKLLSLFTIFFFIVVQVVNAQFYIVGQEPASVHWKQIKTTNFNIIYPDGYFSNANIYANTLELTHKITLSPYLKQSPKPFTFVLHPQSTWANAMVLPAPLHGDFFEIPDQNLYPEIWQYQLSLHEYRHFAQMRKMYQGVGKGLSYVFGQAGPMALFGMFIPLWYIEGDAVFNETIHSKSGRGRLPSFTMGLKAQLLDKKIYKFDKAVVGSYRDYVPDHYTLGYQLVLYGVENYGYDMWNLGLDRVARRPYLLKPFVNGLKTYSGLRKVKYYNKVIDTLRVEWKSDQETKLLSKPDHIIPAKKKRFFTNYRFPVMLKDGSVVAERTGLDDINRFVKLYADGTEEVLFTPGFDYSESLSANDSLLCWNEKQYDLRWSNRDYSIIKIYNYRTKKLRTLTHKTRLFAPSLSPDGKKVVAVSVSENGINSLKVLDAVTGEIITRFSTKDNLFFMIPKWSADGNSIVSIVLSKQGKSIVVYEPGNDRYNYVLPFGFDEINRPYKQGNFIVYTGTYNGVNNIYQLDMRMGEISQLTNVKYGAEDATLSPDNSLIFSDYTADGYRIGKLDSSEITGKKIDSVKPFIYPVDKLVTANTFVLEDTVVPSVQYKEKKYSRLKHLFNLHSWGPMLVDVNSYQFEPNVVMASQNMLGTAVSTLGYYYNYNDRTGKIKFTFDYTGWYPVVGFQANYGKRHLSYVNEDGNKVTAFWDETNLSLNLSVPLRFIKSKWINGVTPRVSVKEKFLSNIRNATFSNTQFTSFGYSLYAYRSLKRSRKDLLSKWSQSIYTAFSHTPFSSKPSSIAYVSGNITFPGFFNHHGLKIYVAQEWKKDGDYSYGDYIATPRGYTNLKFDNVFSVKADYAFPIAYPDWDIPSAAYLTRIYAQLFFDYSSLRVKDRVFDNPDKPTVNGYIDQPSSMGIELYTNWYFLSLPVEFTLGFRGSYKLSGSFVPEFLFGFGL